MADKKKIRISATLLTISATAEYPGRGEPAAPREKADDAGKRTPPGPRVIPLGGKVMPAGRRVPPPKIVRSGTYTPLGRPAPCF